MDDPTITTTEGGPVWYKRVEGIETREVEPMPSQQIDPLLYRMAVGFLGAAMMTAILLVGLLSYQGKPGSDLLIAVPSAVVGGLIGMLVPSPVRK